MDTPFVTFVDRRPTAGREHPENPSALLALGVRDVREAKSPTFTALAATT